MKQTPTDRSEGRSCRQKRRPIVRCGAALAVVGAALCVSGVAATAACIEMLSADVWMVESGGLWRDGEEYGNYRIVLARKGVEHARDHVQVQISQIEGRSRKIIRCVDLPTPGLKGHVTGMRVNSVSERAASVELSIEMKAMEGVLLKDAFLVSIDGSVRLLQEARHSDLQDLLKAPSESSTAK